MTRRSANGLLHVLGAEVGIPQLHLDKEGCCSVAFDEVVVNFEVDEEAHLLFLYASLGPAPAAAGELYRDLLGGNLLWQSTGGATISLDREAGRLVLMQRFSVGRISDVEFKAGVERFVNVAEIWIRRVADAAAEPAADAGWETPGRPPMILPGMLA